MMTRKEAEAIYYQGKEAVMQTIRVDARLIKLEEMPREP